MLLFGALMVIMMVFRPGGLIQSTRVVHLHKTNGNGKPSPPTAKLEALTGAPPTATLEALTGTPPNNKALIEEKEGGDNHG
jgi:hypothetical protein